MSVKHTIELTCDACGATSDSAYTWARISISGSTDTMRFSPDQNFDICPKCWMEKMRLVIYPPRSRAVGQ